MSTKHLWVVAVILAAYLVADFLYFYFKRETVVVTDEGLVINGRV